MLQRVRITELGFTTGQRVAISDSVSIDPTGWAEHLTNDCRLLDARMGDIYLHMNPPGTVDAVQVQQDGKPDPEWWKGVGPA